MCNFSLGLTLENTYYSRFFYAYLAFLKNVYNGLSKWAKKSVWINFFCSNFKNSLLKVKIKVGLDIKLGINISTQ